MAGLTADKLKKDVSIMGITGTYVGEIPETYYYLDWKFLEH